MKRATKEKREYVKMVISHIEKYLKGKTEKDNLYGLKNIEIEEMIGVIRAYLFGL